MDFQHVLDDIYLQLNQCRLHPKETANKLTQLKPSFQGRLFKNKYNTREGLTALEDLITDLSKRSSQQHRLKWAFALHMAADEQASLLGQKGIFTTEGTNFHRTLPDRIKSYAILKGRVAQIYQFGGQTSQQILEQLLIDDGLASRKRRTTLLDPIFKYIGIGSCYHESNQACTVIILAEEIVSLVAPDVQGRYRRRVGMGAGRDYVARLEDHRVIGEGQVPQIKNVVLNPTNTNSNNTSSRSSRVDIPKQPSFILQQPIQPQPQPQPQPSMQQKTQNIPNTTSISQSIHSSRPPSSFHSIISQNQPAIEAPINQSLIISEPNPNNQQIQSNPPQPIIPRKPALIQNRQGSVITYQPNPDNQFYHQSLIHSVYPSDQTSQVYNTYHFNNSMSRSNSYARQGDSGVSGVKQDRYGVGEKDIEGQKEGLIGEGGQVEEKKKDSRCNVM